MVDKVTFKLHIDAKPKERPRFSTRGGFARTYTTAKTRNYEQEVKTQAAQELRKVGWLPVSDQIRVSVRFCIKSPKKTKLKAPKPDVDNLSKALLDALNEVAYLDDTQIVELNASKEWANESEITVTIEKIF